MKVTQVLYSGKGGHGSVAHSLISADRGEAFGHSLIYFGIETVDPDYIAFCGRMNIDFNAILKTEGKHFRSWKMYLKALKDQQPDRILLHSMTLILPTIWYCFFHKAKWIAVEHQSNQFKRKSEWWWSWLALIFAQKVVYLTESYRAEIKRKFGIFARKSKIAVIPNGIDTDYFVPGRSHANDQLKIGMASRINSLRDHATLIAAFEMLSEKCSNAELHIAGAGEGMPNLEKMVSRSRQKESIFLHGNLRESELLVFLQELDVYVHSTCAETMSTAILQAMSVGLPVVVSRIPGTLSLFEDKKEGFLFTLKNATELAEMLELLIKDESLGINLAQQARNRAVSQYSHETMFKKYKQLLIPG